MSSSHQSTGRLIGQYIKYQRTKRQWTIAQLAEKADLTSAYISRLEQGDYESPTIDAVKKIAKSFKMPLAALLAKSKTAPAIKIELPELAYYLHERYFLPTAAIEDMEMFLEVILEKYKEEIDRYRQESQKYWRQTKHP